MERLQAARELLRTDETTRVRMHLYVNQNRAAAKETHRRIESSSDHLNAPI